MYFFNCTCLCLSGYKPYIIKKTKFESDCQIIGSAQNESFHARKMKRTCFNPCRGLRGFRRSRPAALTSNQPKGFPVAPMTLRAHSRSLIYSPGDELLPPPRAVPLPRRGRSWGIRRSKPAALPSIGYRGFAVAPKPLRAPSRSHLYNPGCRVETLLVSMGVMGFLGDLRGRNSKSPPNPLGLAERVPSSADDDSPTFPKATFIL